MSADNYLLVSRTGTELYGVFHCFASDDDPLQGNKPLLLFASADAAIKYAHKLDGEEYHEYGVKIGAAVMEAWAGDAA